MGIDMSSAELRRKKIGLALGSGAARGLAHIGVLEVLNRSDDGAFTADDRLILISVADQIAYAIRNAAIFDRVVDAYCKRRREGDSCDDCPQPLESWAPCKEYRQRFS